MRNGTGGRIVWVGVAALALVVMPGTAHGLTDTTPPTVTVTTPAANASYAQNARVNANYSCSDASGISACVGTVSNGAPIPTQSLGSHDFFVSGYDNAGNKTKVNRTYTVVDKTPPKITISTPADGATYPKNSNLVAHFTCFDTASDIASCVGTVSDGSNLPTGTVGAKSFKVTAKDVAGNTATKTVFYKIA